MTITEFYQRFGFELNPFQHTNADKEVQSIESYFIKPDYFEDVWGSPDDPVSSIVYAPRGGGKTAQRIMIEKRAQQMDSVLTISYVDHDLAQFQKIDQIDIKYHLVYLNRLLLLTFFDQIKEDRFDYINLFSFNERQYLYKLAKIYLYETPASFPRQAIESLKTIADRIVLTYKRFAEPIAKVIQQISKIKGQEIDLTDIAVDKSLNMSHRDNLINLIGFLVKLDIKCIYILVDKVDEQSLTGNDPKASYRLISDLIKDLELLELPNIAFKFFLWDALKPFCMHDARPDRVSAYELKWTIPQLVEMLDARVAFYSGGNVGSFFELLSDKRILGRTIILSELSPRDCIRICSKLFTEQHRQNPKARVIELYVSNEAFSFFARERSKEIINSESNYGHLTRINKVVFTIEELVNSGYARDSAAVRNIINPWTQKQILRKIGIVDRKGKKSVNQYAFTDSRIAFAANPKTSIEEFFHYKVMRCDNKNCLTIYYRDFESNGFACPNCHTYNEVFL